MKGRMQDWPLLCHKIIDHAATFHGGREIVSRSVEGPLHRTDYRTVRSRARRIAKRLEREGIGPGDRVATMAWNTWRHLEAWYGILGLGAVYHTLNPRLFADQIVWIMNDAEDRLLFVDPTFLPLVESIAGKVASLERIVVLTDAAHMPETGLADPVAYEDWLGEADDDFAWTSLEETAAAGLCYTSGTTGEPKGVVYSHRSNVLHAMAAAQPDMLNLSSNDRMMPVVPLFHANGWSTGFVCPMVGAAMVLPGAGMDGGSIHEMLTGERASVTAAVPTVWLALLEHLDRTGGTLPDLKTVVVGGAACPPAMIRTFEEKYDVRVLHAWGMTEMSPLGTICSIKPDHAHLTGEDRLAVQASQGHPPFTVEMKIADDDGNPLPWDGTASGRLKVRGPAVAASYFKGRGGEQFDVGQWFDTGDVARMDPHGYTEITDRAKDVIKSGGEWISSIELENLAVGHEDVAEAAVIGVAHPRWGERPLLIVVAKEGRTPTAEAILDFLRGKVARWWLPDAVEFVDAIAHTATGKIQKTALREQFHGYRLSGA